MRSLGYSNLILKYSTLWVWNMGISLDSVTCRWHRIFLTLTLQFQRASYAFHFSRIQLASSLLCFRELSPPSSLITMFHLNLSWEQSSNCSFVLSSSDLYSNSVWQTSSQWLSRIALSFFLWDRKPAKNPELYLQPFIKQSLEHAVLILTQKQEYSVGFFHRVCEVTA